MSLINVERHTFNKDWTLSDYSVNGKPFGKGIEDEVRITKVHGETCIPVGEYALSLRQSPKFSKSFYYNESTNKLMQAKDYEILKNKTGFKPHDLIWITNVPNFQFVLIHWGNTDDNTEGCYIIGDKFGKIENQDAVLNSRNHYIKFYETVYKTIKSGGQFIEFSNRVIA